MALPASRRARVAHRARLPACLPAPPAAAPGRRGAGASGAPARGLRQEQRAGAAAGERDCGACMTSESFGTRLLPRVGGPLPRRAGAAAGKGSRGLLLLSGSDVHVWRMQCNSRCSHVVPCWPLAQLMPSGPMVVALAAGRGGVGAAGGALRPGPAGGSGGPAGGAGGACGAHRPREPAGGAGCMGVVEGHAAGKSKGRGRGSCVLAGAWSARCATHGQGMDGARRGCRVLVAAASPACQPTAPSNCAPPCPCLLCRS